MLRRVLTGVCLLGFFVPSPSPAQNFGNVPSRTDEAVLENLCAPNIDDERLYEETQSIALNDNELERLRIELLERGYDPGFDLNAADADARLENALREFQAEFSLPVTGQVDASTLHMLGMPNPENA